MIASPKSLDADAPTPAPTYARIDTIKVTFPYDRLPESAGAGRRLKLEGGARLGGYREREIGWLEFSAPRVACGNNLIGLRAERLAETLERVLADAEGHGLRHRLDSVGDARVRRLDLCRDFADAFEAPYIMEAFSRLAVSKTTTVELIMSEGMASGLVFRNGSWRMILYRKDLEYGKKDERRSAIPGVMRFEAQLKREGVEATWIKAHGRLRVVSDITAERVEAWARAAFERNLFHTPILRENAVVDAVLRLGMTPNRSLLTLGAMAAISAGDGLEWAGYAETTQSKLASDATKAGVLSAGISRSVQLDWEAGVIVSYETDASARDLYARGETITPETPPVSRILACSPKGESGVMPPRPRHAASDREALKVA